MPGRARQALVTVRLLSRHSATERSRQGDQVVRSRQATGPQAALSWLPSSVPAPDTLPSATQSSGIRSAQVVLSVWITSVR